MCPIIARGRQSFYGERGSNMKKIFTTKQVIEISKKLRNENKRIVLAGGCFDLLHIGHLDFLTKAKKEADILMVLLENDATIHKQKGENRPINTQRDRALLLEAMSLVDYIVLLPPLPQNSFYDNLVVDINPTIIATTKGDANRVHKERQAAKSGAKVVDVTELVIDQSTTALLHLLHEDL